RDYFGAHTYERVDRPGVFHTDWHVTGKTVQSSRVDEKWGELKWASRACLISAEKQP
ncbi:MAG TPA: hypothetical protein DDZ65_09855, partial [Firmicutes bacterium]|nr:hypothetical protein [Bacillota bacterium]